MSSLLFWESIAVLFTVCLWSHVVSCTSHPLTSPYFTMGIFLWSTFQFIFYSAMFNLLLQPYIEFLVSVKPEGAKKAYTF